MTSLRIIVVSFMVLCICASSAMAKKTQNRVSEPFFKSNSGVTVTLGTPDCVEIKSPTSVVASARSYRAKYTIGCVCTTQCSSIITVEGQWKKSPYQDTSYTFVVKCLKGNINKADSMHIGLACEDSICIVNRNPADDCVFYDEDVNCPEGPCTECSDAPSVPALSLWALVGLLSVILMAGIAILRRSQQEHGQQI